MTAAFRNVDFNRAEPIEEWPFEAILAMVERGSIADWRLLAHAIREGPWGAVARQVEQIASWQENYGADALLLGVIERAREAVRNEARQRYASYMRGLRKSTGLTLREFAELAGTSASRLSAYENGRVAPTTEVIGRIEHAARNASGRRAGRASRQS